MTLQKPATEADKILMDLRGHCAEDPETGAYLIMSHGHRKIGRLTRFWYRTPQMINARKLHAASIDDAIRQIEGEA